MSHQLPYLPSIASCIPSFFWGQGAREVIGCCCIGCFEGWEASYGPLVWFTTGHHWASLGTLLTSISADYQQIATTHGGLQHQAKSEDKWWLQGGKKCQIHWQEWGVSPTTIVSDTVIPSGTWYQYQVSPNRGYISRPGYRSEPNFKHSNFGGLLGSLMVGSNSRSTFRSQKKNISLYLKSYPSLSGSWSRLSTPKTLGFHALSVKALIVIHSMSCVYGHPRMAALLWRFPKLVKCYQSYHPCWFRCSIMVRHA